MPLKMGVVVSLVSAVIGLVTTIKKATDDDDKAEENRKLEKIRKPIIPPKNYNTLEEREKHVKKGPYTVEAMRYSISRNVIPAGYSEEQLLERGFKPEMEAFIERRNKERSNTRADLKKTLIEIKKQVNTGFPDLSMADKRAIEASGILSKTKKDKILGYLDNWILDASGSDRISVETLNNIQDIAKNRLSIFKDAIGFETSKASLSQEVDAARDLKDDAILKVLRRNFKSRGYNR